MPDREPVSAAQALVPPGDHDDTLAPRYDGLIFILLIQLLAEQEQEIAGRPVTLIFIGGV
jgi:hypothetical protein